MIAARPVLELIHEGIQPSNLVEILTEVARAYNEEGSVERALKSLALNKLTGEASRSMAKALGHQVMKALEDSMGEKALPGMSAEARGQIGMKFAENFALHLVGIGDAMILLAEKQALLEQARNTPQEAEARILREEAEERFLKAFKNIGRLAAKEKAY